ncbi:MAG: hypothetical protein QOH57_2060 [Mycobacterium sp.]|nr:hypothetical protein [Mycobacterium sp.]
MAGRGGTVAEVVVAAATVDVDAGCSAPAPQPGTSANVITHIVAPHSRPRRRVAV